MSESDSTEGAVRGTRLAQALFRPSRIALIGASDDPTRLASRPQRLLRRHGYDGAIVPIHPIRSEVGGERAFRSVASVPGGVEHAFIMLPASAIPRAIEDCCSAGVAVATVMSGSFAESGAQGACRQAAMVAAARAGGMRILGPNSLGVTNVSAGVALCANAVFEHEPLRPGALSLVSQSGSMLGAILTRAQEGGLGFAKLISVGNECDIAVGELVHLLVDDPETGAILLFLETLRDADVLAEAARRAFQAGKPIIAYKIGRSAAGRTVAVTHTGAIAGDDAIARAFFRAHGILCVDVFEALFESVRLVLGHRPPNARRVGAVTVSAGAAAMVVDRLGACGIELAPPPAAMIERLASRRIRIASSALIDLPMGRADGGRYVAVLDELLASDHCDLVLAVQGSNATHAPESVRERVLAAKRGGKPLAVFVGPRAERALQLLQQHDVAAFRTPESCAAAIAAYCEWRAPAARAEPDANDQHRVRAAVAAATRTKLNEFEASRVLTALGIAFAPACVVRSGTEPLEVPFPVAAKILSPDIAHKTEAAAVVLDIESPSLLGKTIDALVQRVGSALPAARIDGVLVQTMQRGVCELIMGFRRDPQVGPIALVGWGGALTACTPPAVRLAPVSVATAREMIDEVPGLAAIGGHDSRGGDLAAVAHALHRLSLLACDDRVLEAEINPLIVRSEGVVGVDALLELRSRL